MSGPCKKRARWRGSAVGSAARAVRGARRMTTILPPLRSTVRVRHVLLLELIPGGAKKDLSAAQAKKLLATVRPRDAVGRTPRRVAAEMIGDLEKIYARSKAADKELTALIATTATTLQSLNGMGPSGTARLLVGVGDISRFPTKARFASWNGTAPIDASSGDQVRHRLSRAGNRQINRVLQLMAVVQLRNQTEGRAYFDRRVAEGKTPMEAMRALKRRLSDIVNKQMKDDAQRVGASPGGHPGTTLQSSVADSHPDIDTSDQSLPGPANRSDRYAVVDSVAAKLDLPAHGTVVKDTHFGHGGISSALPTRQLTLVTVPATKSQLEQQLTALTFRPRFREVPPLIWNAEYENHGLQVRLGYGAAGQKLTDAAGGITVPAGDIAITVAIEQIS